MIWFIIFGVLFMTSAALAQGTIGSALTNDLSFGQYPLPFLLTIIMAFIYKAIPVIPDRLKGFITVGVAVGLGYLWMLYSEVAVDVRSMVDTFAYCFIQGAAAVGIYELQDKARKQRA